MKLPPLESCLSGICVKHQTLQSLEEIQSVADLF